MSEYWRMDFAENATGHAQTIRTQEHTSIAQRPLNGFLVILLELNFFLDLVKFTQEQLLTFVSLQDVKAIAQNVEIT